MDGTEQQHQAGMTPSADGRKKGPRSIRIDRWQNGFGFTLRHFIVYPPESYSLISGDRRHGSSRQDEPMDTIFVKSVHENSSAQAAGLEEGDRIISVNGESIAGKSYAQVVQIIQATGGSLHLLVVPKEDDIIQLYFGETAHNPETNPRPRLRSPETPRTSLQAAKLRQQPGPQSVMARREYKNRRHETVAGYYPNTSGCRLSLDGGLYNLRRDSLPLDDSCDSLLSYDSNRSSHSHEQSSDDSNIILRIKKSCEQKEEFLKRTIVPNYTMTQPEQKSSDTIPVIAKEFYARPQKLQKPVWPPDSGPTSPRSDIQRSKQQFVNNLSRIQENSSRNHSFDSDPGESVSHELIINRSQSEETDRRLNPPKLQIVSRRTKQFETGQVEEDKTNFYKSELARLSSKKSVPNVAVRKQEFEQRVTKQLSKESRSIESGSSTRSSPIPSALSGNRTVIVGSKTLHVDPPKDFQQFKPEGTEILKSRYRSSSADTWPKRESRKSEEEEKQRKKAVRQNSYLEAVKITAAATVPVDTVPVDTISKVNRRQKAPIDEERIARRDSYFKATLDSEAGILETIKRTDSMKPPTVDKENLKVIKDGSLHCKVSMVEGKRATDRSWKQIWAILRGPFFSIQKERRDSSLSAVSTDDTTVDVRECDVEVPQDYTKKKNVLRLKTATETEYLLQAEDTTDMVQWVKVIQEQQQESSVPLDPKKGGRNRSPTGQSPASKTRKPSQTPSTVTEPLTASPKSKTWKGKVAKQFRRMQGSGSPSSPSCPYLEGATVGIPLEDCPPSSFSEYVPMIVEHCTQVVEARGLEIVGIYRVPGNTAAVNALTEAVNKGSKFADLQEQRFCDVNVISSLLKLFFRKLPDSLFTGELYPKFIASDKISNPKLRMLALRKLVNDLPDHNHETLKYLCQHLKRVVSCSDINKMETKNLAIVFGPTLVRAADDNMVSMVTDMSHQCRIIESLIAHSDWFFSDDDVEYLENMSLPMPISQESHYQDITNEKLLLSNVHKIEGIVKADHSPVKDFTSKDIVSSIISAANRKITRTKGRKQEKQNVEEAINAIKATIKKEVKDDRECANALATSILTSVLYTGEKALPEQAQSSLSAQAGHDVVIRSYQGLSATTQERIRRFEQETKAMLQRDLTRQRKDEEKLQAGKSRIELEWQQAKRELEYEDTLDVLADNLTDLSKLESSSQSNIRKGGSYESLTEEKATPNGSLKRFKPSSKFGSLDSLQGDPTRHILDDGCDLLATITKTFDTKLKSIKTETTSEQPDETIMNNMKEKVKKFEETVVFRNKILNENIQKKNELRRSESLNKTDKPQINVTLRRSESLNKNERLENLRFDQIKLKRSDSLTKNKKQELNVKRLNKEKENIIFCKLKRKNGMPERSIKRRHTVGGTKDFDKLPWLDNRLQAESTDNDENVCKEKKGLRTSSPDLSSSRLRVAMESEGLAIEVHLLSTQGNVLATLRQQLRTSQADTRPQSMPPVHKLPPLESHV